MCVMDTYDILCACAGIGPRPLIGYQRWRGKVEGLDSPTHGKRRPQSNLDSLQIEIERLLYGVTDDGWKYLVDDMAFTCYHAPQEWIPLMRRIIVDVEYVQETTQGDVPMEEEGVTYPNFVK